jgi:hypothetical protein
LNDSHKKKMDLRFKLLRMGCNAATPIFVERLGWFVERFEIRADKKMSGGTAGIAGDWRR